MRISDWSSDVCSSDLVAPRADRIEPRPHAGILGHVEIGVPAIPFALEIEAERGEDRLAHRLARRIALVALCLDRVEFAREEAQAAGTEAEVVGAKEVDRVAARPRALLARDAVQSARAHLVPQRRPAIGAMQDRKSTR